LAAPRGPLRAPRDVLIGIVSFTLASIACGFAPDTGALIAGAPSRRSGGLLIPCSLAIIGAAFDEQERGAAIGIWSGASALAPVPAHCSGAGSSIIFPGVRYS